MYLGETADGTEAKAKFSKSLKSCRLKMKKIGVL